MRSIKKSSTILGILFRLPWFLKCYILVHPFLWRLFVGIARRIGWDDSQLGWYIPNNGPYAGIMLKALHVNQLWIPLGGYEPVVTYWLVKLLTDVVWGRPGSDVWDVGAHRGYTSLLCAKYGSRQVIALEPDATNLTYLRDNLKANPVLSKRIDVLPVAVADVDGEVDLESPTDDLSQCQLLCRDVPARARQFARLTVATVPAVTLDLIVSEGRTPPGVLKIDVEGAELLVLRGARTLLRQFHPMVLLEYHNRSVRTMCVAYLRELGYSVFALNSKHLSGELVEGPDNGHVLAVPPPGDLPRGSAF